MNICNFYQKLDNLNYFVYGNNPYSKCFIYKQGLPIKFFDIEKDYLLFFQIDKNEENDKIKTFLTYNKRVIFIPLEFIDDSLIGFQLRSYTKKAFYNIKFNDNLPLVYGLNDFKDFKLNSSVFLVEGIKDVQTIKLLYKYSLAYLTAKPSDVLFDYLKKITNKIIFIGDNDKAGKQLKWDDAYKGCDKNYLSVKDCGDYFDNNNDFVIQQIKSIMERNNVC
jgi:hypothetical protein